MLTIFKRKLIKNWLMILGWGMGLALLGYYLFTFYDSFFEQSVALDQMIQALPEGLLAFFGENTNPLSAEGFLTLEFFSYIPIILGIMIISNACKLVRGQEEDGTLELIIAQPVSRGTIFWGRFLALLLSLIAILALTWGGFALGLTVTTEIDLSQGALARPFLSLLALLLFFLALALFLSMLLPSSTAGLVSGFVLIASYFISSMARLDDTLDTVNLFSPLRYYQSGEAISGLNLKHLLLLLGLGLLFLLAAWWVFAKRDLKFGA